MIPDLTWKQHTDLVSNGGIGYPIVEIVWEDANAFGSPDWVQEIVTALCVVCTVGYLVYKDDKVYVVVSSINEVHVGDGTVIPRATVKLMRQPALS